MKTKRILLVGIAFISITLGLTALRNDDKSFEISKQLNIYATLFRDVNMFYVDEVNPGDLVTTGIKAMLKSLDPYTVYYPESEMEDVKLMTTGEYAGIGSVISKKGDQVIIREPYKDSPADKAGLLPGDIILAIDGISVKGKNTEEVSTLLKGQPGKEITIKVQREFETKPLEKKAIREKIQLPSVPYSGMVNDTTGYIYLTSFTDKSAADVRSAIISLKNKGASSLILDLRGNSGGLLDQAVEIVNFFVPKNSKIVDTKGKVKQWDKEYTAKNNPIVPDMPLVVLIDRGSASASEIVSGALQDLDRAVLIGERSYGKGLVQTVRDLAYNTKLKVTTAKYYIPSGRCIQALDYSHRNPDGSVGKVPDSLISEFKTQSRRKVYDGGGISPDIKITPEDYARITQELVLQDLTFDFINSYALRHPNIAPINEFKITDEIYNEFKTYLKEKKQIEPYLTSFHYIFRLIRGAEELSEIHAQQLEGRLSKVRKLLPQFGKLNRSASLGMRTSSGDPMGIVADYINMMLHLDIIGFNIMLHAVREQTENIDRLVTIVGELDALIAAAGFRHSLPAWCVPKLTAAETVADGAAHGTAESSGQHFEAVSLQLEQLYHPLLADPVKNDIKTTNGVLLTGSNASGKSTFLKAVALNMILAQTIHTCCADHCQSSSWRVMTSMALRDDLGSGESYYIVEIRSLKRILDAAQSPGAPVLCFVDEVLRGTNTVERIAASTQILKSLHKPGVCCFAATHDVELTGLLEAEYDNYHFEEQIADGDISFPYLLMPGRATSRNAIRLLEMMGYSEEIIKKADDQAAEFLKTGVWKA